MKICHLITSIDRGGAENHLYTLLKKQSQKSNILLIYFRGNNYWKKDMEALGIKVVKIDFLKLINLFKFIKVFFTLKRVIFDFKPEILHAHLSSMELFASLLKFFFPSRINLVVTKHLDSYFLEGSFGQNRIFRGIFIDRFIFKYSDKIICISEQVRRYFIKNIHVPQKKIKVIYYGVDKNYFNKSSKYKKKRNIELIKKEKNKYSIVCCIARHVKQKSLDFLILSFAEFNKNNPNYKLLLVGDGPERNELIKLSKKNDIYKKIIWIKYSEQIEDILKLSDIFVLPSRYEGFGIVFLEAMLLSVPVIATNASAIPEIIKHNHNGILVEPNNIKQLTKALINIQNKKLVKKFNINSKKLLTKKFNLSQMVKKTDDTYSEILNA